ncbi:UDP-3-O-(3-hydroxymyristoyl)glucosamine N-acyltransferase [Alteromonas sp. a30]|uniref:UDP-3-O-(3-hydroxymyristoyl)glucosamine N-acyltransferase n=1 Tax=Alteromonas sp. a30 TaxID=2730917 RepID=UPI00227DA055|nr:UDP-3-O-(3-hydroxymyristoyl)glucosamine N-acyltransferase [Alteromonas sp. a30]MCY7294315.1 UDP-3-O-(3-hydroxymyristoyl)glucosamine N-acyltransferase [Alteromonas sp. a30]
MPSYTLAELAKHVNATVQGDDSVSVDSIATLSNARSGQISFLSNSKYRSQLAATHASAVILHPNDSEHCPCPCLVMDNPYAGFALIAQLLDSTPQVAEGISTAAKIADTATLGNHVSIGPNAVIEEGAIVEDNVQIGAGCFVGKNVKLGRGTRLWPNVTIYHDCELGSECLIQAGAVIGADGFGYAPNAGQWIKIPQVGRVVIGNKTEVGANSCIDRGALDDTIIGHGVIIDNLVQIAHNVVMGDHSAIAGCSVVAGSVNIGKHCVIGGFVAINGHTEIADKVHITGFSMVTKSITEPGVYSSGMPATTNKEWRKNMAVLRNLGDLRARIKALEKR